MIIWSTDAYIFYLTDLTLKQSFEIGYLNAYDDFIPWTIYTAIMINSSHSLIEEVGFLMIN